MYVCTCKQGVSKKRGIRVYKLVVIEILKLRAFFKSTFNFRFNEPISGFYIFSLKKGKFFTFHNKKVKKQKMKQKSLNLLFT